MPRLRKLGLSIALVGLVVGLVLALIPTHHTYPAGIRGKGVGYVEQQTVSCGNVVAAKRPEVRGYDDECDHEFNRRFVIAFGVVAVGLLAAGVAFAISLLRTKTSLRT